MRDNDSKPCDGVPRAFKRKGAANREAKAVRRNKGGRERRMYVCLACAKRNGWPIAYHIASENGWARDRRAAR